MKPILGFMVAVLALGATGCAHVDVVAPHGPAVYLVSSSAPMPVERRWRTWFLAWGITPFDNTMPPNISSANSSPRYGSSWRTMCRMLFSQFYTT